MDKEMAAEKAAEASQAVQDTVVAPEGSTLDPVDVDR